MVGVVDIQSTEWGDAVLRSGTPTVVEFWHHRCPACETMKPVYEALHGKLGDVKLTRMNLLESRENRVLAIKEGVRSTPTFVVYCGGRPIGSIVGVMEQDEMEAELRALVGRSEACLMSTPLEPE